MCLKVSNFFENKVTKEYLVHHIEIFGSYKNIFYLMCLNIRKAETRRQKLMASRVKAEQAGLVNKRYGVTAE